MIATSGQYIFTVSEVNQFIKDLLDNVPPLQEVLLRGEISNYKLYPSGHHYFTLKDSQCSLKCVMFRGSAARLRFRPENGMQVIASGRISVYPRDGAYQLYCTGLTPEGAGDLSVAFEQLKEKLRKEGLFDETHKKPLPPYPRRIAIVTSPAGAAVHDMIRILRRRYPIAKVLLLPVRVQGTEAPAEIAGAIRYANARSLADVLITGRGGGSLEDLWAFNDERVARAVYRCPIPVLTGIGHEIDHSITDFTADYTAATPSHTAQILWQERHVLAQHVDGLETALQNALDRRLNELSLRLRHAARALGLLSPRERMRAQAERLDDAARRMKAGLNALLEKRARTLETLLSGLRDQKGRLDAREAELERLALRLRGAGEARLQRAQAQAERAQAALLPLGRMIGLAEERSLTRLELRLQALDPFEPLRRGYAVAFDEEGRILRSVSDTAPGRMFSVTLADGRVVGSVTAVTPEPPDKSSRS